MKKLLPRLQLLDPKVHGILWILCTKFSFVMMMTIVKYVSHYPTLQMNWIRSFCVLSISTPFLLKQGKKAFISKQPKLQIGRVVLSSIAMIGFFYAYRALPLAKATTLNFSYALVLPVFAALFLKEKITPKRWIALLIGYVGVWVTIDPVFEKFDLEEGIALGAVLLLAGSAIFVKKLSTTDSAFLLVFYSGLTTTFILGIYFLIIPHFPQISKGFLSPWHPIELKDLPIFGVLAFFSFMGQYGYIQAYKKTRLNFLAGFDYVKIIFATLIGLVLFHETPSWQTLVGGLIILLSSYAITRQEFKKS